MYGCRAASPTFGQRSVVVKPPSGALTPSSSAAARLEALEAENASLKQSVQLEALEAENARLRASVRQLAKSKAGASSPALRPAVASSPPVAVMTPRAPVPCPMPVPRLRTEYGTRVRAVTPPPSMLPPALAALVSAPAPASPVPQANSCAGGASLALTPPAGGAARTARFGESANLQPVKALPAPQDANAHKKITQLLNDRPALRKLVQTCWDGAATASGQRRGGGLNLQGLQALAAQIQQLVGIPTVAFSDMPDTFMRFDFEGNGALNLNECCRCVKQCLTEFRRRTGGEPPAHVPFKTPLQAGYTQIKVLAAGQRQGEVKVLVTNARGEQMVLKKYGRHNANAGGLDELLEESAHMLALDECPQVARCVEIFQDNLNLYMVSGANFGGDWSTVQVKASKAGIPLTENWYQNIFKQAFQGLAHMHRNAVMHCDIKEPNLMLKDINYADPLVVIIDLGLSQAMHVEGAGPCGTPGYIPPETWDTGKWFPRGDVFSMGVVCVQLLANKVPDDTKALGGIFTEGCSNHEDVMVATKRRAAPLHLMSIGGPAITQWLAPCLEKALRSRPKAPQVLDSPWFLDNSAPGPFTRVSTAPGVLVTNGIANGNARSQGVMYAKQASFVPGSPAPAVVLASPLKGYRASPPPGIGRSPTPLGLSFSQRR